MDLKSYNQICELQKQIKDIIDLLKEVLNCGISFSDERVDYKEMQIPNDLLSRIRKVIYEHN
jgi:hypothetical protein